MFRRSEHAGRKAASLARERGRRRVWIALLSGGVLALAGCGGSSSHGGAAPVDRGGFTTADRSLAQTALNTLEGTNIPGTIIQLTATIGLPAVCRVHLESAKAGTPNFDVLLAWKPIPRSGDAFTWFTLTVSPSGVIPASMNLGTTESSASLQAHYGIAYTKPFDPCRINAFGWLTALPLTFGSYPTTGHALKVPNDGANLRSKQCALCVGKG